MLLIIDRGDVGERQYDISSANFSTAASGKFGCRFKQAVRTGIVFSVHSIPPRVGTASPAVVVTSSIIGRTSSTRRATAGMDNASVPRSRRDASSHWNRVGSNEASNANGADGMYFFKHNVGTTTDSTHSAGRSRARDVNREVNTLEAGLPFEPFFRSPTSSAQPDATALAIGFMSIINGRTNDRRNALALKDPVASVRNAFANEDTAASFSGNRLLLLLPLLCSPFAVAASPPTTTTTTAATARLPPAKMSPQRDIPPAPPASPYRRSRVPISSTV
mmetsp:Transcript_25216/g.45626  ORF Transcript_25216/g.45626 Transcript_25216/m.45626 type:complete len:277 (-) Transcript_25216:591-1421(-)